MTADRPVSPRPSSSVILLRSHPDGPQVFMVLRSARSDFAANVYVFPGGSLRPDDMGEAAAAVSNGLSPEQAQRWLSERGAAPPESADQAFGLVVAAARELFEEAGVLLACEVDGGPLRLTGPRRQRLGAVRRRVERGQLSLASLLVQERLRLDWEALVPFSHWITPRPFPIRFTTRFFLAQLPEGQEAYFGPAESTEGCWIRPEEALKQSAAARFPLVFATAAHLKRLCGFQSVEALLRFGRGKEIRTTEPIARRTRDGPQPELREEAQVSW